MQTKPFADKSINASTQCAEAAHTSHSEPVELSLTQLQFVSGGLAPRGGWSTAVVIDTTDAPRGGWQ